MNHLHAGNVIYMTHTAEIQKSREDTASLFPEIFRRQNLN